MRGWLAVCMLSLASLWGIGACGDDGAGGAGMGGGPPPPSTVGDPCGGALLCPQGTVCASSGRFGGQCTAACSGDMGCLSLNPQARCVASQCGIVCNEDADCVGGTVCTAVGPSMVCTRP